MWVFRSFDPRSQYDKDNKLDLWTEPLGPDVLLKLREKQLVWETIPATDRGGPLLVAFLICHARTGVRPVDFPFFPFIPRCQAQDWGGPIFSLTQTTSMDLDVSTHIFAQGCLL